ncbi:MAG: LppX_LprAFG lipoprotein [Actinomycetota bacterium]|nr:LppX_LprAFG lipoprotein [Actinomycetota bacterium]
MRIIALVAALVIALVTSCNGGGAQKTTLPDGAQLLNDSSTAMRTVTTIHFTIRAQGNVPNVPLRYADGRLTRQGTAQGTAKVDRGGQLVQEEFVIIGDTLYLRGPTGDFQKLPSSVAGAVYDPSVILNPDRGIAALLVSGKDATTEARELVGRVDTYRLRANFPRQSLGTLVPGLSKDTPGQVWIAVQGSRVVKAQFPVGDGLISVHFADYDAPVLINGPA